ncbi:hypothetical protein JCM1841_004181 [Sporobolomyces salmonicolor]
MSERTPLLVSSSNRLRPSTPPPPGSSSAGGAGNRECYYDESPELKSCNVFESVHRVYRSIQENVDVPLSDQQIRGPEVTFAVVNPLETSLAMNNDPSIVYVLLLCRLQFLREKETALASSSLNETRANMCEYLAVKLLRHQATVVGGGSQGLLAMARALVGGLHAFQGARPEVLERIRKKEGYASRVYAQGAGKTNALELAILGKARNFIKSQATQRVISAIYDGKITYSSSSFIDILPDRWKSKDIALYNVRQAPLLDHYRLRVPKYRSMIDLLSFLILFFSFLHVINDRHKRHEALPVSKLSLSECWFFVYALGYSLDKSASIFEHGWTVFAQGLTNGLDLMSVPIYVAAFALRVHSVRMNDAVASDRAYAILSCAACLLFPRIAFATISSNLLIMSLRAMLADFFYLMGITVFCFLGFVFALNHLCDGYYSVTRISEWLVFIYFGLDGSGIDHSPKFHPILGPVLFISFAALSNTLLTSVLVAILSTTYSQIASDAAAEDMFRKAVMTFEGVKSDSLFDYTPPLNLIAITVLWPLSHFLSPRWFHKINVAATRVLSLPILLLIALYERQSAPGAIIVDWLARAKVAFTAKLPHKWAQKISLLEGAVSPLPTSRVSVDGIFGTHSGAHWETVAVFEYGPDGDKDSDQEEDDYSGLGGEDEVEELLIETPQGKRISSRASAVLDPARVQHAQQQMIQQAQQTGGSTLAPALSKPTPISRQPSFIGSSEAMTPRAASRGATPPPPFDPDRLAMKLPTSRLVHEEAPTPPAPDRKPFTHFAPTSRPRRDQPTHERLPSNATDHRAATSNKADAGGSFAFPQMSTSAPTAKESPLSRLYNQTEGDADAKGGPLRRRLSLSHPPRGGSIGGNRAGDEANQAQMMAMIQTLVVTVERLERKLEEKGKSKDKDDDEESALDESDDDDTE